MATSVELRDVTCGYGTKAVLTGVNSRLSPGEVVALIGPNGSGKTTLMKTMCGAVRPLLGTVLVGGDDAHRLNQRELARRIGYVPQIESPAFDFSAGEIVLMGRISRSDGLFETAEDRDAARLAMERADCLDISDRRMSELSGGEGQRVRIARALAQEAPILMMDEPTTHLDIRHQLDIGKLVRSLAEDGLAILVAVHDLNWAASFADRAVLLGEGRVLLDGNMGETLESPVVDRAFEVSFSRARENGLRLYARSDD